MKQIIWFKPGFSKYDKLLPELKEEFTVSEENDDERLIGKRISGMF